MVDHAEQWYATAHFKLGEAYRKRGLWQEARSEYTIAIRLRPDSYEAWNALGETHLAQGNPSEAKEAFRRAAALSKGDSLVHLNLGRAFLEEHNHPAAASEFAEALALDPQNPQLHCLMGKLFLEKGEYHEALHHFEIARSGSLTGGRDQGNSLLDVQLPMGLAHTKLRAFHQATTILKEVLREHPTNVKALNCIAEAYRGRGMQYEAIKYLRRVLHGGARSEETHRNLAELYRQRGMYAEAIREYNNVLALGPKAGSAQTVAETIDVLTREFES